ncbi:MAG: AMP-binding protein, partial [Deltaproteobacteria bacterium]|nr:AMP-binding protein [Deltaproteobacteria bacterium]
LPFFGVKPIILDPGTGEEVLYPNQEGVLCIERPWPGMARTIYGDHDRFVEATFSRVPGFFFTGDGAKQDEDGDYWILGRIDDVINSDGHRLGIPELESVLIRHELVTEAAVVGFPHPIKGSGVYAFVHLNERSLGSDDLKRGLKDLVCEVIGDFAVIDLIQWVDTLPKTPSGKILRVILQKIAAGDIANLGDFAAIADPAVVQGLVKGRMELEAC